MPSQLQLPTDRPRWTRTGRVVYNRKPHHWRPSDLGRISQKIQFPTNVPERTLIDSVLEICRQVTLGLLQGILALVSLEALARPLLNFLESLANELLYHLGLVMDANGESYDLAFYRRMGYQWWLNYPADFKQKSDRYNSYTA